MTCPNGSACGFPDVATLLWHAELHAPAISPKCDRCGRGYPWPAVKFRRPLSNRLALRSCAQFGASQ